MRIFLFLIHLLAIKVVFAQNCAVVSADKMNVLYIGVDNPISIALEKYACKDLLIEISQGEIIKFENNFCKYSVKVLKPGKVVIKISDKENRTILEQSFRVKRIPDPFATVGGVINGEISKAKLRVQKGVVAYLENFDFDAKFEIISFNFSLFSIRGIFHEKNIGPVFNSNIISLLHDVENGDAIIIDNILIKGPDVVLRKINGIAFRITDSE